MSRTLVRGVIAFSSLRRSQDKIVGRVGGYVYNRAACQNHVGSIGYKAGLRDEHFVARVEQRLHRQVHCFAYANGNKCFGLGIIGWRAIAFRQHIGHSFAQFQRSGIGRIGCISLQQAV